MSKTVDERVVEMRFDNKQFEQNVQTSLSTLDKLKRSLNLDGAAKGLENVNSAAKNCNMSGLTSAVETVHAKFSAFEVMAVTALANITNSVINTGKQMLHSLTIEPISQGFEEYELKMGSIQTIMMSTGASLEEVNGYLQELNTYSDKTIYSFQDMTSNIGKFTNAGVKLEDAVMAIQGISNEAAISGANANEASRAMYNFAQALSAGYVKLIDWKSIENANMATVEFKTQLLEAAVAAGTVEKTANGMYRVLTENNQGSTMDEAINATKNFNDSLQYQWMTTDVLVNTLRDYADETTEIGKKAFAAAQEVKTFSQLMDTLKEAVGSGWAMTWEILFGDFEEAKTLWTSLSNAIGGFIDAQSDARNSMLQGWKDMGGRTALIDAAKNAFQGLISVVTPVKEAFREIFPPITAEKLMNMTNALKDFTSRLKLSDTASANLKSTFKGLFAVLDIVKQAFSAVLGAITPLFGGVTTLGGGILGVTGGIGEWLVKMDEFIKKNDVFGKAIQGVITFVKNAINAFKDFIKTIQQKFNLPSLEEVKQSLKDFLSMVKEKIQVPGLEVVHNILGRIHERISQLIGSFGSMTSGLGNAIGAIGNADFNGIIDLFNSLALGGLALGVNGGINGFFDNLIESVTGTLSKITNPINQITGILDGVKDCLSSFQKDLQAKTLLKIAEAIAILAASIFVIALIDSEKLSASLGAITVMFVDLIAAMAAFEKLGGVKSKGASSLIVFAGAVLVLSGAVKKLAALKPGEMAQGLIGVGVLLAELDAFMATAKFSKGATSTATGMVIMAAAIKILAGVVSDLSSLKWEEMAKGLVGVGVLLAEVDIFLNTAKLSGKAMTTATGIVILAAGLKILASVCKTFAEMSWEGIAKGLAAVGALLLEVTAFTKLTGNAKHVISTGLALVEIAAAMKIFASAMADFAKFSWEQIGRGLVAMGGALAEVAVAVNLMPKNMIGIGTGLVIVGAALEIIANVLGKFGGFSWEEIAKGLVALGGALAELSIALNLMKGTLSGSAALLVAAAALLVMTPVLSILGAMSWEGIAKGLIALAGAFTVIGVAGALLTPLVPTILGLSGAFALIGVGVLAIGAGLLAAGTGLSALAVGFTALAAAGAAGATAIVASLTVIITGVAALIPAVLEKIGEGIIAFCRVIAESAPAIGEAIKAVVLSLLDVLLECVPQIADGALALIDAVLVALVKYTPSIVDSIFQFLIKVLEGIAKNLPELIKVAIDVLMAFFSGIVDALSGIDVNVLLKGIVGVGLLSAIMLALSAVASLVPGAMAGVLGMGVIIAELALVLAAVGALAQIPGLSWLIGEGGKLLEGIGTAIGQFVGGIVGGFMSGVSSQFPQIGADLSAFMTNIQPFIEGASQISPSTMDGVKALAETILILTAADILQGLTSWITGGSSLSEFATELVPFGEAMKEFSVVIAGMDGNIVANAATAGKTLAEMAATLPNSGGVLGFFAGENDMKEFGEQLVPFGEAMMGFSLAVKGLDADAVTAAAIAGKAMAEMATTIPNTGGVVSFFAGDNDMKEFGEQLIPFGEAMMDFSTAVKGLDADAIVNSATAGKALVELAKTVPNSGGVVGFFAGENDMDMFGEQLVPFGKAMKSYSDAISGIDVDAITNSATAGKSLVELANTLPNTGGIVSWFTGDNDIGAFGESLVLFGENFSKYSDYMKNVDAGIVTSTTNAATSIVELQKSLPKEGGWFSDDKTLADFGKDMSSFGSYFSSYYSYISSIDTGLLSSVITQTNRLVDMANGMAGLDTSGMTSFGSALTKLGEAGITGFINAFNNANSKVTAAASNMLTTFVNAANAKKGTLTTTFTALVQAVLIAINAKQQDFQTAGSTLMVKFIAGVKTQDNSARSTFTNIISGCLTAIKNKYSEFQSVGTQTMVKFIAGVRAKDTDARNTFTNIISGCLTAIKNKYSEFQSAGEQCMVKFIAGVRSKDADTKNAFTSSLGGAISGVKDYYGQFYDAGSYLVDGFAKGISENTYKAEAKARAMAAAAARAAEKELDEHSPSKVGYRIGDFFGVAFVNAIGDYTEKAYKAGSGMAKAARTGLGNAISKVKDFIDSDIDTQPTIRPVLDLSNVEAGTSRLNAMFSRTQAMSISTGMNRQDTADVQNGENSPNEGSTFNFNQYNYSPKALSRVEIYRQTKNQFSAMERMVKA